MAIHGVGKAVAGALVVAALTGCIRFAPPVDHEASADPAATVQGLLAGDFTGDGGEDVLVATAGGIVRMDQCGADCLEAREQLAPTALPVGTVADFDGDGIDDLLRSDRLYFGGTAGAGRPEGLTIDDSAPYTNGDYRIVHGGDFTGDGLADLVGSRNWMTYYMEYAIAVGDGAGGFTAWQPFGVTILNAEGDWSASGDLDGDGDLELALRLFGVKVHNPPGGPTTTYELGIGEFTFGDIDGDGRDDLAHRSSASGVTFHRSTGTGFVPFPAYQTIAAPYGSGYLPFLLLRDLDGDGFGDLVYDDRGSNVVWRSGTGDGGFPYPPEGVPPPWPLTSHRVFADVDGDGLPEVVQSNGGGYAGIRVYSNTSH